MDGPRKDTYGNDYSDLACTKWACTLPGVGLTAQLMSVNAPCQVLYVGLTEFQIHVLMTKMKLFLIVILF